MANDLDEHRELPPPSERSYIMLAVGVILGLVIATALGWYF